MPLAEPSTEVAVKTLDSLAVRLSLASENHAQSAFTRIDFPASLDADRALMPNGSISLSGHEIYATLQPDTRRKLGLLECVNFFSLNIHGEQALIKELIDRVYRRRSSEESDSVSRYLQHFIQEENSHTFMLAEFCTRYYGRVIPEVSQANILARLSKPATDLLFFARVYVLETLLDHINVLCMRDETLDPTVRAIHRSHHLDEARHLAFDRAIITQLMTRLGGDEDAVEIGSIRTLVSDYARYAAGQLVSPRVYRECGIPNALKLSHEVLASEAWRTFMAPWRMRLEEFFGSVGLHASVSLGSAQASTPT